MAIIVHKEIAERVKPQAPKGAQRNGRLNDVRPYTSMLR